jgi:hypothetical protein
MSSAFEAHFARLAAEMERYGVANPPKLEAVVLALYQTVDAMDDYTHSCDCDPDDMCSTCEVIEGYWMLVTSLQDMLAANLVTTPAVTDARRTFVANHFARRQPAAPEPQQPADVAEPPDAPAVVHFREVA